MRIVFLEQNYGPAATTEMIISRIGKEKEEYFATRYLELGIYIQEVSLLLAAYYDCYFSK